MTDPLGLIGAGGARPVSPVGGAGKAQGPGGGPSFSQVLMENLKQVNELQGDATRAIEDLQAGRSEDVEGVILATQKADLAFKMLQQVRNKVVQAYSEIRDMRV